MYETSKSLGNDQQTDAGNAWATYATWGSILIERFIFYGSRVVFWSYLGQSNSLMSSVLFMSIFYPLLMLLPVLAGLVIDYVMDQRMAIVTGAAMTGVGALVLVAMPESGLPLGLALFAVGSTLNSTANWAYLGAMLPRAANKFEGGMVIGWGAINIGAAGASYLAGFLMPRMGAEILLAFFGIASLAYAVMYLFLSNSTMPAPQGALGLSTKRDMGSRILALLATGILLMIAYVFLSFTGSEALPTLLRELLGMLNLPVLLIGFASLFLVSQRQTGIRFGSFGLILIGMASLATIEMILENGGYANGPMELLNALNLPLTLVVVALLGLFLYLGAANASQNYQGSLKRIGLGTVLMVLVVLGSILFGFLGMPSFYLLPILWIAQAVLAPIMKSILWRLAPQGRKATAMGLSVSVFAFATIASRFFKGADGSNIDYGNIISWYTELSLMVVFVLCLIAVWFMLRNLQDEPLRYDNPFA